MLEKQVEDPFIRWCKKIGLKQRKINGLGHRSWPDRMICIPAGVPFFIEFKAPGKLPTPDQEREIQELRELGYDVEVHDNTEEAKQAVINRLGALGTFEFSRAEQRSGMVPSSISATRDKILARAQRSGIVPRSGAREDKYNSRGVKNLKKGKTV